MHYLNNLLINAEKKSSPLLVALLIGLLILLIAMLLTTPQFEPIYHGAVFSRMAEAPFDFTQNYALQNRILAPLIGHLIFLRGNLFVVLPLIFAALLLGTMYYFLRLKEHSPKLALLITACFGFSALMLTPLISPGYTDTVTYFFLLLAFIYIDVSIPATAIFFSLALLNHEQSAFLLPAIFCYARYLKKNWVTAFIYLFLSLIPAIIYRTWISTETSPEYSVDFYLSNQNLEACMASWNKIPLGIFFSFKLLWIFPFWAMAVSIQKKEFLFTATLLAGLLFPLLQYVIAYDITRMYLICFPLVLLSILYLLKLKTTKQIVPFILVVFIVNLLIPFAMMAREGLFFFYPFWIS